MTSWRDTASPQAQQDLDTLLDAALGFAQQQLATRGEFFPYAVTIDTTGQVETIAARPDPTNERPTSADVVTACFGALTEKRTVIHAGAVVADVRVRDLDSDAIQVDLEHADGHALTVLLPYAKKRLSKKVEFGQLRAQTGQRQIWT